MTLMTQMTLNVFELSNRQLKTLLYLRLNYRFPYWFGYVTNISSSRERLYCPLQQPPKRPKVSLGTEHFLMGYKIFLLGTEFYGWVKEFMIGYYFRTDVKHYTLRYLHVRHGKIHSLDRLRIEIDHYAMYHTHDSQRCVENI